MPADGPAGRFRTSAVANQSASGQPRRDAFTTFFDRHFVAVLRRMHAITGNRETAEEVTADAFLLAHERFDEVATMSDEHARAWLMVVGRFIARNQFRSAMRRRRLLDRLAHEPLEHPPTPATSWEQRDDARRDQNRVEAVLDRLDRRHRDVIVLADLDGLHGPEIAARLGISHQAARLRLMRARRAFKREHTHLFGIQRRQEHFE